MASQNRPSSNQDAPDPATSYERAKPEKEAGMGRLDNNNAVPTDRPDDQEKTVKNRQKLRQINADNDVNDRPSEDPNRPMPGPENPDHSMKEEEPLGWDQAPLEPTRPRDKRHPRTEGKGGVP